MTTTRRLPAALLAATLALGALAAPAQATDPSPSPLPFPTTIEGAVWQAIRIAGSGLPWIEVPAEVLATFELADGNAAGSGGCNRWFAPATVDGETIDIGEIGSTMMYCGDPAGPFESAYLAHLGEVARWSIADGILTLADADGLARIELAPRPDTVLEGTTWILTGLHEGDAVVSAVTEPPVTLALVDGTASGFAGCNQWTAGYTLADASLVLGPVATTRMACEGRMEAEAAWVALLGAVAGWEVTGTTLTLLDAAGAPLATLEAAV